MTFGISEVLTRRLFRLALLVVLPLVLSACASGALAPGLVARMDAPGATLDRTEALNLINQFRASRGVAPLLADEGLDAAAQRLAQAYAASGRPPSRAGVEVVHMRFSAGYANFAQTFSGWRGRSADADVIADASAGRAGLGVVFSSNSAFGTHWVLLLSKPLPEPVVPAPVPN